MQQDFYFSFLKEQKIPMEDALINPSPGLGTSNRNFYFHSSSLSLTSKLQLSADVQRYSDDDSGCVLDEYAWVSDNVKQDAIDGYFSALQKSKVPYINSSGERWRREQLVRQLPPQDSDSRYCTNLNAFEEKELRKFDETRKCQNLGRGLVGQLFCSGQKLYCHQCKEVISGDDLIITAPERFSNNVVWHPHCFVCVECKELLVDLIYFQHNQNVFCGRHHAEQIKPRCFACDELIFDRECIEAERHTWHAKHFNCGGCSRSLGGQCYALCSININNEDRKIPLCVSCYESNNRRVKCHGCLKQETNEQQQICQCAEKLHLCNNSNNDQQNNQYLFAKPCFSNDLRRCDSKIMLQKASTSSIPATPLNLTTFSVTSIPFLSESNGRHLMRCRLSNQQQKKQICLGEAKPSTIPRKNISQFPHPPLISPPPPPPPPPPFLPLPDPPRREDTKEKVINPSENIYETVMAGSLIVHGTTKTAFHNTEQSMQNNIINSSSLKKSSRASFSSVSSCNTDPSYLSARNSLSSPSSSASPIKQTKQTLSRPLPLCPLPSTEVEGMSHQSPTNLIKKNSQNHVGIANFTLRDHNNFNNNDNNKCTFCCNCSKISNESYVHNNLPLKGRQCRRQFRSTCSLNSCSSNSCMSDDNDKRCQYNFSDSDSSNLYGQSDVRLSKGPKQRCRRRRRFRDLSSSKRSQKRPNSADGRRKDHRILGKKHNAMENNPTSVNDLDYEEQNPITCHPKNPCCDKAIPREFEKFYIIPNEVELRDDCALVKKNNNSYKQLRFQNVYSKMPPNGLEDAEKDYKKLRKKQIKEFSAVNEFTNYRVKNNYFSASSTSSESEDNLELDYANIVENLRRNHLKMNAPKSQQINDIYNTDCKMHLKPNLQRALSSQDLSASSVYLDRKVKLKTKTKPNSPPMRTMKVIKNKSNSNCIVS